MKKAAKWILFSYVTISIVTASLSQNISRYVFGVGGGLLVQDQVSLTSTLGQHGFAGTLVKESSVLSIGFQQIDALPITPIYDYEKGISIQVSPNPFLERFVISVHTVRNLEFDYQLYNSHGSTVLQGKSTTSHPYHEEIISVPAFNEGLYYLKISWIGQDGRYRHFAVPLIKVL